MIETKEIVRFSSNKLGKCIQEIPIELLEMDVDELEKNVKPTKKDRMLKINLQNEINRSQRECTDINNSHICRGVCHLNHFLKVMENKEKLAWMLMPSSTNELRLEVQNDWADERLDELLRLDIFNENGELDRAKAELVFKAIKMVKDRTSPVISRSEVKQLQVKADLNKKEDISEEELDEKLHKLIRKAKEGTTCQIRGKGTEE